MAKKKQKQVIKTSDSSYFLKLVIFLILGCFWVKVGNGESWQIGLPVGLIVGLGLAQHDKFKFDRKVEYAVLLVAMLVGFWAPIGLYINL